LDVLPQNFKKRASRRRSTRRQAHRFGKLSLRHPAEVLLARLSRTS
jgi:hypothetical protein